MCKAWSDVIGMHLHLALHKCMKAARQAALRASARLICTPAVTPFNNVLLHPCSEMAAASEELARDNCSVSDEVVQLREDKASQAQNMDALQVQLCSVTCFVPYM